MAVNLAPTNAKESALIATLHPGNYTAIVCGVGGTGPASRLVEAYDLDTGVLLCPPRMRQIDRMGNPAVNVALIPFARKDEYNAASPSEDAAGRFTSDIVATLTHLARTTLTSAILGGRRRDEGRLLHLNLEHARIAAPAEETTPVPLSQRSATW